MNFRIDFEKIPWIESVNGCRQKKFIYENQQVRIVEFSEGFIEQDWCKKGHAGYVLDGEFSNDYNGVMERYKKGDVIFIPRGEHTKHKVIINKRKKATLLLFEILES